MWQLVLAQSPVEGGSWMQMNMASFIVLDWLLTSLCTMLNWLGSNGCLEVALCRCMGEGAFRCSLTLYPRDLPDSPMYELEQLMYGHWYMIPVWLALGSLSLGLLNAVLSVLVPLKCTWIPLLLHNFLNLSAVLVI